MRRDDTSKRYIGGGTLDQDLGTKPRGGGGGSWDNTSGRNLGTELREPWDGTRDGILRRYLMTVLQRYLTAVPRDGTPGRCLRTDRISERYLSTVSRGNPLGWNLRTETLDGTISRDGSSGCYLAVVSRDKIGSWDGTFGQYLRAVSQDRSNDLSRPKLQVRYN